MCQIRRAGSCENLTEKRLDKQNIACLAVHLSHTTLNWPAALYSHAALWHNCGPRDTACMQGRGFGVGLLPEGGPQRTHDHARRASSCRSWPSATPLCGRHHPVARLERRLGARGLLLPQVRSKTTEAAACRNDGVVHTKAVTRRTTRGTNHPW